MGTRNDRRWWILGVLCLSVLLVVVDNTIVNVALPTISRDLHASTEALQWIVDGYTLASPGCCSSAATSATASGGAASCRRGWSCSA